MIKTYCQVYARTFAQKILQASLLVAYLAAPGSLQAEPENVNVIEVEMGGYRFMPHEITLTANQPAVLRLVNTDKIVPHNFTLKIPESNVDIDIDVSGGESADVELAPLPSGSYPFYCGSKMLFFKSHREKGMEGSLIVTAE